MKVGAIAAVSTLSRPAVSHHLKVPHEAGILRREKRGKETWLRIDREALVAALETVLDYVNEECMSEGERIARLVRSQSTARGLCRACGSSTRPTASSTSSES